MRARPIRRPSRIMNKSRINALVAPIPHGDACTFDPESPPIEWPARFKSMEARPPVVRTEPLLQRALIEYFGSQQLATHYFNQVHRAFRTLLADAAALQRINARYPAAAREDLGPISRMALERIAGDHPMASDRVWPVGSEQLRPLLEEMNRRRSLPLAPPVSPERGCNSAFESAVILATRLRQLESAFNGLFVIREQRSSVGIDTDLTFQHGESERRALDDETSFPAAMKRKLRAHS